MRELSARLALRAFPIPPRPPFVSPAKAGAQEPRWCRGHGADLSAESVPPARCLGAREKTAPSVLPRPWRFDALLVAIQSSVVPGSRRSPGRRCESSPPDWTLRAFPIPPRSPFVSPAKAGAQEPRWCDTHWPDLSAADIPPARCSGSFETRQRAPCCGGHSGSMPSWLPSRARWSLGPGVRREDDERALRQIGPSALFRFLRALPSFPPRKRGPRSRGGATPTGRTSAQRIFRRHDAWVLVNRRHLLC